jgi:hypothetical protein
MDRFNPRINSIVEDFRDEMMISNPKNASPPRKSLYRVAREALMGEAWSNPLIFAVIGGFLAVAALCGFGEAALPDRQWSRLASVMAAGTLVCAGALAAGAMLGFLFGIPRAISDPSSKDARDRKRSYGDNTNLEQVSDWLTKIVIALGLAQLNQIPTAFQSLATVVSKGMGTTVVTPSLAGIILLYFSISGFLTAYLWTRLYLTNEFTRADRAAEESPAFLEGLIEALLYQPQPEGFKEAIKRSDEYRQRYGDDNWRIWRSRACAFGQMYGYIPAEERNSADAMNARSAALDALKHALALNPSEKLGLRRLWDPKMATPQESDLVVFFEDDAFKQLLD